MSSLYSSEVYPPAPQPATTMQLASTVLAKAIEATLDVYPYRSISVADTPKLAAFLEPLEDKIIDDFKCRFGGNFLILPVKDISPSSLYTLQKQLGINAFKKHVVFPYSFC
jgi:hypothetical protein